ncbi:BLUF domain-containing protein [Melaminivora sp.]|uniref:BLUF domain-containing protein n=1 Tax=Melaminivora sp. TaxID=1933032 RepID=UPI0028B12F48|nr:BLUF domain-containing protein [Melaminivora sp.]
MNNQALNQFAYHSKLANGYDVNCVGPIIKAARVFNALHGITGVLLFDGERFFQYVEGESATINALAERIHRDPRHQHVTALLHEPLHTGRRYPHWSMAFSSVDEDAIIDQMIASTPHEAVALLLDRHLTLDID